MKRIKKTQVSVNDKIQAMENSLEYYGQSIDEIDADIDDVNDANLRVMESIVKTEDMITQLKSRCQSIETNANKACIVIKGIVQETGKSMKQSVKEFLKHKLEITKEVGVVSVHRMAKNKASPWWIKLQDPDDEQIIFTSTSNLKDKVNKFDKKFQVRKFETEEKREVKNRQQDLIRETRCIPMSHQAVMKFNKGELMINDQKYKKSVIPPLVSDVLMLEKEQEAELAKLNIHTGEQKTEEGSSFQAFAIQARTHDAIKKGYCAIKAQNLSSTHIMCGYRLFGTRFYNL